jgi:tetratricopeptide (TPR) repeat protein
VDVEQKEKLTKLADNYIQSGKYFHAAQIYHRLLNETESNAYKFRLAETYLNMGFREAFDKYLISVLEDFPDSDEMRLEVSSLLMKSKNWEKLIEILSFVDADKSPEVNFILGFAYLKLSDYKLAQHFLELFIKSKSNPEVRLEATYYLGVSNYFLDNFEDAIKRFKESKFHQNNNPEFYFYFASSYRMLGMLTHASLYITKALRLSKKKPDILLEAGKIYNKLEQFSKAEKYLNLYTEVASKVPNDYLLAYAEALIGLKKTQKAEMVISMIEEGESDNPEVIALKSKLLKISERK